MELKKSKELENMSWPQSLPRWIPGACCWIPAFQLSSDAGPQIITELLWALCDALVYNRPLIVLQYQQCP